MKTSLKLAALICGMSMAGATMAQNATTTSKGTTTRTASTTSISARTTPEHNEAAMPTWQPLNVAKMTKDLGLTAEQTKRLEAIAMKNTTEHKTLMAKEPKPSKEECAKMDAASMEQCHAGVKEVLTADQYSRWMKEQHADMAAPAARPMAPATERKTATAK
ncbi:MAG: hypothetical protein IPI81_13315 [Flavobacteriales bacterium]|nr:hypothetical protein [Flavobacteriales bacterium]MCC6938535.1 hypothetical protein [Flavobacteriales bacterium]